LIKDLQLTNQWQQVIIDECLHCANFRHLSCDYKVGDKILILLLDNPTTTLDDHGLGPYSIIQVHANGTVTGTFQQTMHITE